MFWKKKDLRPKPDHLRQLEISVLNILANSLREDYKVKLLAQISYVKLISRIKYSKDLTVEFYPLKLAELPQSIFFDRKDEFKICTLKIGLLEHEFSVKFYMVLGWLTEMRIAPIVDPRKLKFNESDLKVISIDLDDSYALS